MTRLSLINFSVEPYAIINLPKTITDLSLSVSTSTHTSDWNDRPVLETKLFPPRLVLLGLYWSSTVAISLSLEQFNLTFCSLTYEGEESFDFPHQMFKSFPNTLERLFMLNMTVTVSGTADLDPMTLLPNLKLLTVNEAGCGWFAHIPRSVEQLDISSVRNAINSPLFAQGQLLKHLPPSLRKLRLPFKGEAPPPQDCSYLPQLRTLRLLGDVPMPSSQLRLLPRSLKRLSFQNSKLDDADLPFLPPYLKSCYLGDMSTNIAPYISIACLARCSISMLENAPEFAKVAKARVHDAKVHQ